MDRTINMTFSTSLLSLITSSVFLLFLWCSSLFWVSLLINISEHLLNSPLIPLNLSAPFFPNCQWHICSFLSVIWGWDQLFNISAPQKGKKSKRRNKVQPSVLMGQRGSSVNECCLSKCVLTEVVFTEKLGEAIRINMANAHAHKCTWFKTGDGESPFRDAKLESAIHSRAEMIETGNKVLLEFWEN